MNRFIEITNRNLGDSRVAILLKSTSQHLTETVCIIETPAQPVSSLRKGCLLPMVVYCLRRELAVVHLELVSFMNLLRLMRLPLSSRKEYLNSEEVTTQQSFILIS